MPVYLGLSLRADRNVNALPLATRVPSPTKYPISRKKLNRKGN